MGRHLEFDRARAVALAADAFWRSGYEALPALELAEAMGVAKSSLYNTFGSKKTLFMEALDQYAQEQRAGVARLAKRKDLKAGLRELLLDIASDNSGGRGCLLVNSAAEFGVRDAEIQQRVRAGIEGMTQAVAALLRTGQASGAIRPQLKPDEHAIALVAGIAGLRVLAKGGFSAKQLRPVIDSLLGGLSA